MVFQTGEVFILSILIHELGHALTAKRYGLTGLSITLHGFGGFATSGGVRSPRQALTIALAGPGMTFALGILCFLVGWRGMEATAYGSEAFRQAFLIHVLGRTNVMLGFLKMIPVLPWDGGQALQAILAHRMPEFKAMRAAAHVGLVVAALLLVYGIFEGGFFGLFAFVGLLTCYGTLATSGGVRFGEVFADRRHRSEMAAVRKREEAWQAAYLGDVKDREQERSERERLRRLLGE